MRLAPLAALALLTACAAPHNAGARAGGKEGPRVAVPFFADRRDQWGPAALAGVLTFWGKPTEPEQLRREVYFPKQRGSTALDLRNAALARGLSAEMAGGSLAVLRQELEAGRPVIVLVNDGVLIWPNEHFMVVTGYNDWLGGVYAHWGPHKDYFIRYRKFEKTWEKTGHWLLFVSRPAAVVTEAPKETGRQALVSRPSEPSIIIDNKSRTNARSPVVKAPSAVPSCVIK